ncbi:MAG: hypothetical protein JWP83_1459 [Mycobacterium sp.]|jgi:hypothetical protein|nr:hypothetical protein [Mycobacterium sp.]
MAFSKLSPRNGNLGESYAVALSPERRTPEGVVDAIGDWMQGRDAEFDRIWITCADPALRQGLAAVLKTAEGPGWLDRVALQSGGGGPAAHDMPQDAVARPKNRRSVIAMGGAAIVGAAAATVASPIVRRLASKGSPPIGSPIDRSSSGQTATPSVASPGGVVQMDSFSGANDDAKLAAAMRYAAAQTYIQAIQLPARVITFNMGGLTPYNGMKIIAPFGSNGPKDQDVSGSLSNHQVVLNVGTGTSSWFDGTTTYYNIYIGGLAFFNPGGNGQFWHQPLSTAPGLYACQFDSLSFYGFSSVFGNPSAACTMTQVSFTGHWVVIGFTNTAINLVFSDCSFWADAICNMSTSATAPSAGTPMFQLSGGKSRMGMLYLTTWPGWVGLNLAGGSGISMGFYSLVIEGTSANNATYPLVTVQAGDWRMDNCLFDYVNPASGVNGVITQSGGQLTLNSPRYLRASGASSTFPLVYQTDGHCTLYDPYSLTSGESIYFRESGGSTVTAAPGAITYN